MAPKPPARQPCAAIGSASSAAAAELAEPSPSNKKKKPSPSKSPPPEKPAAAGEDHHTKSSSSSEVDSSDEAEQRPNTNPSIPAPAGHSSSSEEDSSSDEAEQRPNTNPSIPAPAGHSSSSEEDSSSGDEHEAEQYRNTNPSILVPAGQEEEGDSYESEEEEEEDDHDDKGELVGLSNVTAKRGPSPSLQLQDQLELQTPPEGNVPSPKLSRPTTLKRTMAAAELAEPFPPPKKKKAPMDVPSKSSPPEKPAACVEDQHTKLPHMTAPAKEVAELLEKVVAAKKVAKLLEKAVAAKVAKPPPRKEAAASAARQAAGKKIAKKPPPSKSVAAVAQQPAGKEAAYNAEKHLEKRDKYPYLAGLADALDREDNTKGMYNAAFLNIADDKAAVLNAKIKKQNMDEVELSLKRSVIERQVIRAMSDLIK